MSTMGLEYADEKLWKGVHVLAGGTGTIQERLLDAWLEQFIRVNHQDLPPEIAARWHRLSEEAGSPEGTFVEAIPRMSDEKAQHIVEEIVNTTEQVSELARRTSDLKNPPPD